MKKSNPRQKAIELGKSYARRLFKEFSESKRFKGEAFKWERFPGMCGSLAKASVFTLYSDKEWFSFTHEGREGLEQDAANVAEEEAHKLKETLQ